MIIAAIYFMGFALVWWSIPRTAYRDAFERLGWAASWVVSVPCMLALYVVDYFLTRRERRRDIAESNKPETF